MCHARFSDPGTYGNYSDLRSAATNAFSLWLAAVKGRCQLRLQPSDSDGSITGWLQLRVHRSAV